MINFLKENWWKLIVAALVGYCFCEWVIGIKLLDVQLKATNDPCEAIRLAAEKIISIVMMAVVVLSWQLPFNRN
jgi:hypothetical protein